MYKYPNEDGSTEPLTPDIQSMGIQRYNCIPPVDHYQRIGSKMTFDTSFTNAKDGAIRCAETPPILIGMRHAPLTDLTFRIWCTILNCVRRTHGYRILKTNAVPRKEENAWSMELGSEMVDHFWQNQCTEMEDGVSLAYWQPTKPLEPCSNMTRLYSSSQRWVRWSRVERIALSCHGQQ
jgi:hypothetical protein